MNTVNSVVPRALYWVQHEESTTKHLNDGEVISYEQLEAARVERTKKTAAQEAKGRVKRGRKKIS
jgi:hypothetical protein